jgi:ketosteroid isomerase-like protein
MTRQLTTPESVITEFSAALQKGEVDVLAGLYEADAVLLPEPGAVPIAEPAAIREALGRFAGLHPTMTNDIRLVVITGDIAIVHNAWRLEGTGPDGAPVTMGGISADVLRRRTDGGWRVLIDNPWGP